MPTPSADRSERSHALAALLSRVALGDRAAFATLYRDVGAHLFGVILRISGDRAQAEDVLQEVFVNVWRSAASYDAAQSQALTWLTSVARNRAIDSLRRTQAQPRTVSTHPGVGGDDDDHDMLADLPSDMPGPLDRLAGDHDARALRGCMDHLSSEQRQCLSLSYYQGLSHTEVADHLAQPLGTVKSWVRRALLALKQCLSQKAAA